MFTLSFQNICHLIALWKLLEIMEINHHQTAIVKPPVKKLPSHSLPVITSLLESTDWQIG
jgi:hypothetical protein